MCIVNHFMDVDSTLVVTQQQASGELSTYWYMITVDHFMCSTLAAAQVLRYVHIGTCH